jgi:hypothetical protein
MPAYGSSQQLMKKVLYIAAFLLTGFAGLAQSKDERAVIERTYLLSHTVFGTKDSLTIEGLFAKQATYGHSSGVVQNRAEAIAGIIGNKSFYTDTAVSSIKVIMDDDDAAIVRHLFKANEHKADGTVAPLNFSMMLVWVKEKGKWRLMGRQAVKLS